MISRKQAPYTGPYASSATKHDSDGPTVEALKRAISRLGYLEWKGTDFTRVWPAGGAFDKGFRKWQQAEEMPADGVYGEQAWKQIRTARISEGPKKGKPALDAFACRLLREDWASQNVPDEADFRAALTLYCLIAEAREDHWHYVQYRPVDVTTPPEAPYVRADCSSFVIMAYKWASTKSGLAVPDPSKQNWTGYGNTDYHEDDHPRVSAPYKVGMLAHYDGHVTVCRRPGNAQTSIWTSHGQEAGPMPVSLHYRSGLRFVVAPPLR